MPGLDAFSVAAVKIGRVYGVVVGVIRRISHVGIGLEGVQTCCSVGINGNLLGRGFVDAVRAAAKGKSVVVSGARAGAEMMCMGMRIGIGIRAGVRSSVRVVVESNSRAGARDSVLSKAAMVHVGGNRRGRGRGLVAGPITFHSSHGWAKAGITQWLGLVAPQLRSRLVFRCLRHLGERESRNRESGMRKWRTKSEGSPGTIAVVPTQ
mgnify:CR=1 FL=1